MNCRSADGSFLNCTFVYCNARLLDLAGWQHRFGRDSREARIEALSYYQNDNGIFSHALEPDA